MAMRICPKCSKQVPATLAVAFSERVECPHCNSALRASDATRIIGAFIGLLVGFVVWKYTRGPSGDLAWLLPEVYAFFAYSFAYAAYVMVTADLVVRPVEVVEVVVVEAAPHGAHDHGAHH
jgi:Na+/proline symporter